MTQALTPQELENLFRAQAMEDALKRWNPKTKQEARIATDSRELLRLAVRLINSSSDREEALDELESFLR